MCGIAGGLYFARDRSRAELVSVADAMGSALVHRGPDDEDAFVEPSTGLYLSHRRLAIIDTSEKGRQPMRSKCGRIVISYNGEIYNVQELKKDLLDRGRLFRGHSDTEVLVEGIAEYGPERFLPRVNGMFAFGAYDFEKRVLWLARDRLGIKPLYYGIFDDKFFFASETKALCAHPEWQKTIDRNSIAAFLRHSYIPAPHSIFNDISKLMPGHLISVDARRKVKVTRYWSLINNIEPRHLLQDAPDAKSLLSQQLETSVKQQMIADVPLGAFLSGGIDSSLVVAMMVKNATVPVKTFSIGFHNKAYDEAQYASKVAKHLGTNHIEIYLGDEDLVGAIPDVVHGFDEPFADSSQLPTFLLSKMSSEHVRVALSGDGGDELFAGYDRYFSGAYLAKSIERTPYWMRAIAGRVAQCVTSEQWDRMLGTVLGRNGPVGVGYRFSALLKEIGKKNPTIYPIVHGHWPEPERIVRNAVEYRTESWNITYNDKFLDPTERWQYLDSISYLPDDILTKVDRTSMANSLEVRVPFLDHNLVELAWRLPLSIKSKDGIRKAILRDLLLDYLPLPMIDRPKKGFGIPIDELLRGPLREWADDLLNPGSIMKYGFLDHVPIMKNWKEHKENKRNWGYWIWDVIMLQAWLEMRA